ncbi:hypothetical protein BBD39_08780 [Arsenophonus endosymbiont of Bemisia tabaci Asia II 3]|nr:hypothetical protein BBD39_08780 [Arsenophonus endosymbiont of Bemisia tabaci Asia II 3]
MKPINQTGFDTAILCHRAVIETVFDELKNLCQIEQTRHRSPANFVVHLLGGRVAYCLMPSKPKIPVAGTYLQAELIMLIPNSDY